MQSFLRSPVLTDANKGYLLGIIAVIGFGLTLPVTRFLIAYLDPIFIGLGRACLAALVAAIILLIKHQTLPTPSEFAKLTVVSLGVVIAFPILTAWAMQSVPASHGGVILGVLPLASVLASRVVSKERPSIAFYLLSLLGMCLVVIFSIRQSDGLGHFAIGDIAMFLAVVFAGFAYALGGQLAKTMGGWRVICWALLIAFPFVLVPALLSAPSKISMLPSTAWFAFCYLSLVSQLFAFIAWYQAMAFGGIARISQIQLLQPFVTLLAATLLLGETLNAEILIFTTLVLLCVGLGKRTTIN